MIRLLPWRVGIMGLAGVLLATMTVMAGAQQRAQNVTQRNQGYDVSRETVVEGKVVQYAPSSSVAPLGPHVALQTGAGVIDVHLGNAKLLEATHFSLASGDSLRIVGENVPYGSGTQFLARVIQKGNQTLTVRTVRGFPLAPSGKLGQRTDGGAL
jgi:DNA/RNA endonuclease YhcR with UshA esterase domain